MTKEIRVTPDILRAQASLLRRDLGSYCGYRLRTLYGMVPGAGAAYHDGRLAELTSSALESYAALIEGDVADVNNVSSAFSSTDAGLARGCAGRS